MRSILDGSERLLGGLDTLANMPIGQLGLQRQLRLPVQLRLLLPHLHANVGHRPPPAGNDPTSFRCFAFSAANAALSASRLSAVDAARSWSCLTCDNRRPSDTVCHQRPARAPHATW